MKRKVYKATTIRDYGKLSEVIKNQYGNMVDFNRKRFNIP